MSTIPAAKNPGVVPVRSLKRNLAGYIRSAKAGHDVLIGSSHPEVRLVRASAGSSSATGFIQVAPDLLATLVTGAAEAAASRVAEAQCAEADIDQTLKQGLGDPTAQLLVTDTGAVWACLYFRAFCTTLHKLEFATALPHISLSALLAYLSLRLENDHTLPTGRWQQLQDNIFGRRHKEQEGGA
jgi:antitoxin (DNA-binding transcriptional repressor) of toxin-antitoxin stability system